MDDTPGSFAEASLDLAEDSRYVGAVLLVSEAKRNRVAVHMPTEETKRTQSV